MGDESRVRILHLLWRNREMVVADLEQVLDFTQTKTSRQLAYLKNAGLVSVRRLDNWMYYFLKEEAAELLQELLGFMEKDPQAAARPAGVPNAVVEPRAWPRISSKTGTGTGRSSVLRFSLSTSC
ncbi:ArsR/SmtB family transcription factor [Hymenobacter humi]|uniref:ArsR/SmtB family transcription factor n=1 Tax=Hymenobacter humi TaxID=1411620 RepID=A0ABW2UA69_9BACT